MGLCDTVGYTPNYGYYFQITCCVSSILLKANHREPESTGCCLREHGNLENCFIYHGIGNCIGSEHFVGSTVYQGGLSQRGDQNESI
jgi:hypothetical protein